MPPTPDAVDESFLYGRDGAEPCFGHFSCVRWIDALLDELRRPHLDVERDFITNLRAFIRAEDAS